jgi:very-short-patch-repair endonuclease
VLGALLENIPSKRTESALEVKVWRLLTRPGMRAPTRQYDVHDPQGRFVARVDFAYPEVRVAVEADGHKFHAGKKAWARDLARTNALIRLGWIVYRVTWEDAKLRGAAVGADVKQLLAHRSERSMTQN